MGNLTQEEREYVAGCKSDWGNRDERIWAQQIGGTVAEATEAAAIQCVREQIVALRADADKKKKQTEERIAEILGRKAGEYVYKAWTTYKNKGMDGYIYSQCSLAVDGRTSADPRIVQLRAEVRAECDSRNEVLYQEGCRKSAKVEVEVGAFRFSREYAI